jgi:hypothetical protein
MSHFQTFSTHLCAHCRDDFIFFPSAIRHSNRFFFFCFCSFYFLFTLFEFSTPNTQMKESQLVLPLLLLNVPAVLAFGAGDVIALIVGLILGFVCLCAGIGW